MGKSRIFLPGSEICWATQSESWSEMGPYGSVGAHIKTGKRYMAQEHFETPPGPKRGYKRPKKHQTILKSAPNQPSRRKALQNNVPLGEP